MTARATSYEFVTFVIHFSQLKCGLEGLWRGDCEKCAFFCFGIFGALDSACLRPSVSIGKNKQILPGILVMSLWCCVGRVWSCSREVKRYCLLALKVFDHISDGGKAVHSTEFCIYFFYAETIAHGR